MRIDTNCYCKYQPCCQSCNADLAGGELLVPCLPAIESPNLKLKKASFQKMFSLPKCLLSICQRTIKKMFNCGQRFYGYLIKYPCMADLSQVAHQNILKFHILMRFFTTALSFERLVYNGNQ